MNDWLETVIVLLLVVAIAAVTTAVTAGAVFKFTEPIVVEIPGLRVEPETGDMQQFLMVAERFKANHEYTAAYNCQNYSHDLKYISDQLGFNTKVIFGCKNENGSDCHDWLQLVVDFEPQKASFVDYSKIYPYFKKEVR